MPTIEEFLQSQGVAVPAAPGEEPAAAPVPPVPAVVAGASSSALPPLPEGFSRTLPPRARPVAGPVAAEPPSPGERSWGQALRENSLIGTEGWFDPETIGATVGGSLGFLSPVPGGLVMGAGIGAALGRGLETVFEDLGNDTTMSPDKLVQEMGWAGLKGGVGQAIGGPVGNKLVKVVGRKLAPYATKMESVQRNVARTAERLKVRLLAGQATGKNWQNAMARLPGYGLLGSKAAEKFQQTQEKQLDSAMRETIAEIVPNYEQAASVMGMAKKKGAEAELKAAEKWGKTLWDGVDAVVPKDSVHPMENLFRVSTDIAKREAGLRGQLANPAAGASRNVAGGGAAGSPIPRQFLKPDGTLIDPTALPVAPTGLFTPGGAPISGASAPAALVAEYNLAAKEAQTMTFERVRELQSRLGALAGSHPDAQARRRFSQMYAALDRDLANIGKANPGLEGALGMARSFHKNRIVKDFLKNETFQNLQKEDASILAESLLKPGTSIEEVQRIKKILPKTTFVPSPGGLTGGISGTPVPGKMVKNQAFEQLAAGTLWNLFKTKSRDATGRLQIGEFLENTGPNSYSPETLTEIFGPVRAKAIEDVRKMFMAIYTSQVGAGAPALGSKALSAKQLESMGKLGITGAAQVASAGALATMGINPIMAAAVSIMSPLGLSRLVYSERAAKWLSTGLRLSPLQKKAGFETGRIGTMMAVGTQDWPFSEEATAALREDTAKPGWMGGGPGWWMEGQRPFPEVLTPETPPVLNPRAGVPVQVPPR